MNDKSKEYFQAAREIFPGGVNSPVRSFKHVGMDPIYFARAHGAHLYDVDGKGYVDFCLSFGPHILGHTPSSVVSAIQQQAAMATSFGACHPKEVELGKLLLKGYPFLDRVRLVNSGTEAVMTAIRLARGYTKRPKILKFEGCYHGHSDGLLAKSGSGVAELTEASSSGVPDSIVSDTLVVRFDSMEEIKQVFAQNATQIAAVIVEPIPANYGLYVPTKAHLEGICNLAKECGALVIFDEVITGFRVGLSGASGHFDLKPDIVTLGKIIGGGLPLAAVAGTKAIMNTLAPLGEVYQAGTLSGNPLATAAGVTVLQELFQHPPYRDLEARTAGFAGAIGKLIGDSGTVSHFGSLFWIRFGKNSSEFPPELSEESRKRYTEFFKHALAEGIYFPPSPYEVSFLSTTHTQTLLNEVLEKLKRCLR